MIEHEHVYDFFGLDWSRAVDEDFDALPPVITLECACGRFLSEQEIIRRVNAYEEMVDLMKTSVEQELDGNDWWVDEVTKWLKENEDWTFQY